MEHPNIARVLVGGTTDNGRPYFVMELVKGIPLTQFCDDNKLGLRQRLALFSAVCKAIQHAHHKGVIHRDIKPSNVMVTLHDGQPVPKVIDFGVSKAISQQLTEKTMFTAYGQMSGTPAYMSPEQAEMSGLDIDTRSDVYSLGVLLYELLTSSTPLEAKSLRDKAYAELQRMIREDEPPRPSLRVSTLGESTALIAAQRGTGPRELGAVLRGELDWIVMKALEKNRDRRYESANTFAADVERYLRHEAVEACPPSAVYRVRKFIRRNRIACTTGSLVTLSLLGGILFSALAARDALYQRRLAEESLQGGMQGDTPFFRGGSCFSVSDVIQFQYELRILIILSRSLLPWPDSRVRKCSIICFKPGTRDVLPRQTAMDSRHSVRVGPALDESSEWRSVFIGSFNNP